MTITYTTVAKTARLNAVLALIDAGAGPGTCQIASAAFAAILATFTLNDPAAVVAANVMTFSGFPKSDTVADNSGTAAVFRIRDLSGTEIFQGSVGTSGTDMIIDNPTIVAGQTVTINSITITS